MKIYTKQFNGCFMDKKLLHSLADWWFCILWDDTMEIKDSLSRCFKMNAGIHEGTILNRLLCVVFIEKLKKVIQIGTYWICLC